MEENLDVTPYVSPTRFSGLSGVFLARAMLQAAPETPSPRLRAALLTVRDAAERLRAVTRERMRTLPPNLRPLDALHDAGWVGLRETLEAKSRLEGTPAAERAAELLRTLFPDGTAFVRSGYREQWAASQLHLERIEEEGLTDTIAAIAGAEFLPFITAAHAAFGEALGLGEREVPSLDTTAVQNASIELAQAVADYGRILAGELDRSDADSIARFRRAVAPIDALRKATRRARSSRDDGEAAGDSGDLDSADMDGGDLEAADLDPADLDGADIDAGAAALDEPMPAVDAARPVTGAAAGAVG